MCAKKFEILVKTSNCPTRKKVLLQNWQVKLGWPRCVLRWLLRLVLNLKVWPHSWQKYLASTSWQDMWVARFDWDLNVLEQTLQLWGFSHQWSFRCLVSRFFTAKDWNICWKMNGLKKYLLLYSANQKERTTCFIFSALPIREERMIFKILFSFVSFYYSQRDCHFFKKVGVTVHYSIRLSSSNCHVAVKNLGNQLPSCYLQKFCSLCLIDKILTSLRQGMNFIVRNNVLVSFNL